jgi:peptide/nickel transport system permease protein
MIKYFGYRIVLMVIFYFVVVSAAYFIFQFAQMDTWFFGMSKTEMLKIAWDEYLVFAENIIKDNYWGEYSTTQNVWDFTMTRIPITFKLNAYAFILYITAGLGLGITAAYFQGKWIDRVISYSSIIFASVPEYVSIGIFVVIFGLILGWAPTFFDPSPETFQEQFFGIALPVITISFIPILKIIRIVRAELIEQMNSDYVQFVLCKGFSRFYALRKHALRNSLAPFLTNLPIIFGMVISISFVIEIAFDIPGAAALLYNSVIRVGEIPYIFINLPCATLVAAFYIMLVMLVAMASNILMVALDPSIVLNRKK